MFHSTDTTGLLWGKEKVEEGKHRRGTREEDGQLSLYIVTGTVFKVQPRSPQRFGVAIFKMAVSAVMPGTHTCSVPSHTENVWLSVA